MTDILITFRPTGSTKIIYALVSITDLEWAEWTKRDWFYWIHFDSLMYELQDYCRANGLSESGRFDCLIRHALDFGPLDE